MKCSCTVFTQEQADSGCQVEGTLKGEHCCSGAVRFSRECCRGYALKRAVHTSVKVESGPCRYFMTP